MTFTLVLRRQSTTSRLTPSVNKALFLLFQTDAQNYKIVGILKQIKFRLPLRHVSVHTGTIIGELFRA